MTTAVCLEELAVASENNLAFSPDMPELTLQDGAHFAAAKVHGPAEDPVGMIALIARAPFAKPDDVALEVSTLADLISQRILLMATLATLQRVATEGRAKIPPPFRAH